MATAFQDELRPTGNPIHHTLVLRPRPRLLRSTPLSSRVYPLYTISSWIRFLLLYRVPWSFPIRDRWIMHKGEDLSQFRVY
jgi:hypothetical protein